MAKITAGGELELTDLGNLENIRVFALSAHAGLGLRIAQQLGVPLSGLEVVTAPNGEVSISIRDSVRGRDVFLVSTGGEPINDNLMELLILANALRGSSAGRITVVLPCYPYARQDRKDRSRTCITAKLVADMLQTAGVHRVIAVDLHASQIQGFFNCPCDNLFAEPVFRTFIRKHRPHLLSDTVIVAPDAGGVKRAKELASKLGLDIALIHKERKRANVVDNMILVGEVKAMHCVLIDDIVDTAGTLTLAAQTLMDNGALTVCAFCTHPVLSGPAVDRIQASPLTELVVADTLPLPPNAATCQKIIVVSVARLLADAIRRTHQNESISYLFGNELS